MPVPQGSGVINRKSARQAVYEEVCDWIITGVLEPGEKILDSELGEYFHVSRTPVREALQQLQSQKLVLVVMKRGIWHDACHAVEGHAQYYFLSYSNGDPDETAWKQIQPAAVQVAL